MRSILSLRIFTSRPGSRLRFFIKMKFSTLSSTLLYTSIIRLYPQNPVFKIVHDESVKVYLLPRYNGNVQQNPLCVESCVTKKFSMSHRCWCNVWLVFVLCTGVVLNTVRESATPDSKANKQADAASCRFRRHFLCGALFCNFSTTEHEGLSTYVQRECSAEPFMRSILSLRIFTSSPGSRLRYFIKMQIQYSY